MSNRIERTASLPCLDYDGGLPEGCYESIALAETLIMFVVFRMSIFWK
jgi:hypothetical protein